MSYEGWILISFPVSVVFSCLFCNILSFLLPPHSSAYTIIHSLPKPATPAFSYKTSPTIKILPGSPHPLIPSCSTSLFSPGLSLVPTLNILPGDDAHISMYSIVLWCMCMYACCPSVVQVCFSRSSTQYRPRDPSPQQCLTKSLLPTFAASTWNGALQSYCPTHSKMQHDT